VTQLLDPTSELGRCIWDEAADGCAIPEPAPIINPHISEEAKLCFAFGCDAPPRDLSDPAVVPLPAGGLLLATALCLALALRMVRALTEYLLPHRAYSSQPYRRAAPPSACGPGASYSPDPRGTP